MSNLLSRGVSKAKKIIVSPISLVLLLLVSIGVCGYLFMQFQQTQAQLRKLSNVQAQEDAKKLVAQVGQLMDIPTSEQPTIATVTDKSKLADQPFFLRAQNGDKVLIFTQDKRVILFRPSTNKIIDVTPISTDAAGANSGTTAAPTTTAKVATVRVALYNGSTTAGMTTKAAEKLKAEYPQVIVATKGIAHQTDYTQTQVIDLTGDNSVLAGQLASTFGGTVAQLPAGETKPDTDLLIIMAK